MPNWLSWVRARGSLYFLVQVTTGIVRSFCANACVGVDKLTASWRVNPAAGYRAPTVYALLEYPIERCRRSSNCFRVPNSILMSCIARSGMSAAALR